MMPSDPEDDDTQRDLDPAGNGDGDREPDGDGGEDEDGEGARAGEVECPYCGEPGDIAADFDPDEPGEQVFVQDCAVCCHPWTVRITVDADGEMTVDVDRA